METLMSRRLINGSSEELSIYHGTSVKKTQIVTTGTQVLLLTCYYPTQEFELEKLNEPLCQFNYGGGRKSPLMNKSDARRLVSSLEGLKARAMIGSGSVQMGDRLECGEVHVTGDEIVFGRAGGRFKVYNTDPTVFIKGLIDSLNNFINEKGEQYPFLAENKYCNGVNVNTMMLVTHHGDLSYEALPSYLRYSHSTDGCGGELTLQYGKLRLHLNEGHARGVSWVSFLRTLSSGLEKVSRVVDSDSKCHTERLYSDHVVLNKYNFYISMIREYRGTFIIISSDLSCTNSKVSFIVEGDNLTQLKNFIKAVVIYLEKRDD